MLTVGSYPALCLFLYYTIPLALSLALSDGEVIYSRDQADRRKCASPEILSLDTRLGPIVHTGSSTDIN